MHDLSPAVRDTTIELVGKHIVNRPDLATQYLPQLIGRLSVSLVSPLTPLDQSFHLRDR
jgi:cohesin loading factor subunit SCC2